MPDIPPIPIRDNHYKSVRIPLVTKSGETVGVDIKFCRSCGVVVFDTETHRQWHKHH